MRKSPVVKAAGILAVLAALIVAIARSDYINQRFVHYKIERLIRSGQGHARTTLGRLSNAPYAPFKPGPLDTDSLGKAQLTLLTVADSSESRFLQSQVHIATQNWRKASDGLLNLSSNSSDHRILNDLGVVLLQLAEQDSVNYFKALNAFNRALELQPNAPEPLFNKALILRKLQFSNAAEKATAAYLNTEKSGSWHDELVILTSVTEDQVATQLQSALNRGDFSTAEALFNNDPELCRIVAMRYSINPLESSDLKEVASFIGEQLRRKYRDETLTAMLDPLDGIDRVNVIQARSLVSSGAADYLRGDNAGSLAAYDQAETYVVNSSSTFDSLWVDLNRADTEVRLGHFDAARTALEKVVLVAEQKNMRWLVAMALSAFGSTRKLNSTFVDMINHLDEAVRIFEEIHANASAVRAQSYLASYRSQAGDLDGALKLATKCLQRTKASDHTRSLSALLVISNSLYKKGLTEEAVLAGNEAVLHARQTPNPLLVLGTNSSMALLSEFVGQSEIADAYLTETEQAIRQLKTAVDIERSKTSTAVVTARILINRGKLAAAEKLLRENVQTFSKALLPYSYLVTETWTLLGRTYALMGRPDDARQAFQKGVAVAEENGSILESPGFRQFYDDLRRETYDSAIEIEYTTGAPNEAWTYMQKYRAKLFLEFLVQSNPSVEQVHSIAIDRSRVQTMIPNNVQIVEYAILPDRLLIWVSTNNSFQTRSVEIARTALEEQIREFLAKLRAEKPITSDSEGLYKILIEPIRDLLDANRVLAIIPDRGLHGIPFGALKDSKSGYLIQAYKILVSPTLTHLLAVNGRQTKRGELTTFGSAEDVAEGREIGSMKEIYPAVQTVSGAEVTKVAFLSAIQKASVFHYVGHSARDAVDPLRSSILLDGNSYGPNTVTAADIVEHRLPQNALVVLSSCDSSVGSSKDGIGMRGLTSAFLISGAGAVVGSLWPVESSSTSELMIRFHKAFARERLPVVEALRNAQLSFIEANPNRTHPYYWSGFVVTGNLSAVR